MGERGQIYNIWDLLRGDRFQNEAIIRSLCQSAYLGNNTALCRSLGRYKIYVDTQDVGMASHLLLDGFWEMWVTEALLSHIKPGMTALDIGAHCGYFTLLMADLVGPSGFVHAFEPNPSMAALLQTSLQINGYDQRAIVHQVALGDRAETVGLMIPEHEPKNAHVVPHREGIASVQGERLDAFPVLDADIIKIDVEGAEENLWTGMTGLLEQDRPLTIFLEFTPGRYASASRFLDEILSYGFSLRVASFTEGVIEVSREQVLQAPPTEDQMLVLTR